MKTYDLVPHSEAGEVLLLRGGGVMSHEVLW